MVDAFQETNSPHLFGLGTSNAACLGYLLNLKMLKKNNDQI